MQATQKLICEGLLAAVAYFPEIKTRWITTTDLYQKMEWALYRQNYPARQNPHPDWPATPVSLGRALVADRNWTYAPLLKDHGIEMCWSKERGRWLYIFPPVA
jgi:hypothetical protein